MHTTAKHHSLDCERAFSLRQAMSTPWFPAAVCVASFRGIRWHVAHNRRNMLKISEILLRWSLLAIYSVFVCATCGRTS